MWKLLLTLALLCASLFGAAPPKLVVVIVIDQFRYDYLTRFRSDYKGGLDRLLNGGAVFTNAHLDHFPTVTAVGHAAILTGATPAVNGIVGNDWYDRSAGARVTGVSDQTVRLLGAPGKEGASPRRLLASTIGDELKMARKGASKVIGVSLKDRAAILLAGHMADGAYWFDGDTGNFVSSTFYFAELPAWAKDFNARRISDQFAGREWTPVTGGKAFTTLPATPGRAYYDALEKSPFGNDLLVAFAERAIEAEQLGARGPTDLLAVSFSSNDMLGHETGPHAPEVRDISIRTDQAIERLFRYIDGRLGLANIMVVLTADHGVSPLAESLAEWRMPGGRMAEQTFETAVQAALSERYGSGAWVTYSSYGVFYLNQDLIRDKKLGATEVHKTAAEALWKIPGVFRVYTREQLASGGMMSDVAGRRVANGFHYQRSGDVIAVLEPYWSFAKRGVTHGALFSYDSHVPLIFMGAGVKPGRYDRDVLVNDIAPTLATLLGIETPSGSTGRVPYEMIQ